MVELRDYVLAIYEDYTPQVFGEKKTLSKEFLDKVQSSFNTLETNFYPGIEISSFEKAALIELSIISIKDSFHFPQDNFFRYVFNVALHVACIDYKGSLINFRDCISLHLDSLSTIPDKQIDRSHIDLISSWWLAFEYLLDTN